MFLAGVVVELTSRCAGNRSGKRCSMTNQEILSICYDLARLSTCVKAKFGSVVVSDGEIVGHGWNGSPNSLYTDCQTLCVGGIRKGIPSGTCLEKCYATHAEQWAILEAGNRSKGAVVYVAGFVSGDKSLKDISFPIGNIRRGFYCSFCSRIMWAAGIVKVVCDSIDGPLTQTIQEAWDTSFAVASR